MRICLVTGLIGSGKSEVCKILQQKGFSVYDSDSRTKALYASDPALVARLEALTGLPKSRWKELFAYPEKLSALEAIVHPLVLQDFLRFARDSCSQFPEKPSSAEDGQWVFFESAIAGDKVLFCGLFQKVLLVRSSKESREKRNTAAAQRQSLQQEVQHWDYLIENNGSLEELRNNTEEFIKQL